MNIQRLPGFWWKCPAIAIPILGAVMFYFYKCNRLQEAGREGAARVMSEMIRDMDLAVPDQAAQRKYCATGVSWGSLRSSFGPKARSGMIPSEPKADCFGRVWVELYLQDDLSRDPVVILDFAKNGETWIVSGMVMID